MADNALSSHSRNRVGLLDLPTEILTEILVIATLVCPATTYNLGWIKLGHVSSRIRGVLAGMQTLGKRSLLISESKGRDAGTCCWPSHSSAYPSNTMYTPASRIARLCPAALVKSTVHQVHLRRGNTGVITELDDHYANSLFGGGLPQDEFYPCQLLTNSGGR